MLDITIFKPINRTVKKHIRVLKVKSNNINEYLKVYLSDYINIITDSQNNEIKNILSFINILAGVK